MYARILIIDDEPLLAQTLVYILQRAGYVVACAGNGGDDQALIGSKKYDIAILDPVLPGTDSFSFLDLLRVRCPQTRAIMFTTDAREASIQRAFQKGAQAYLLKPMDPHILLQAISDLLMNRPVQKSDSVFPNDALNR